MRLVVVPFSVDLHLAGTVDVLLAVRRSDPMYPPPQDAQANEVSLTAWLLSTEALARWVATIDGEVVGHVLLCEPHGYLTAHLDGVGFRSATGRIGEVAKLFVSPSHQREAVGTTLLRTACAHAWASGRQPTLAVVVTSRRALRLYEREGMQDLGGFVGVHGQNRVLIQNQVDMPIEVGGRR